MHVQHHMSLGASCELPHSEERDGMKRPINGRCAMALGMAEEIFVVMSSLVHVWWQSHPCVGLLSRVVSPVLCVSRGKICRRLLSAHCTLLGVDMDSICLNTDT
mmetsp:Transcript_43050/g.100887  ORF Transcript_43050/g.100887 Transcript_43050/m.100887 type:complete len:104 (-) Transcript_43050:411-722(-)